MNGAPGTYGSGVLDLVIVRSACGPTGLVSVPVLLPGTGSVVPGGGVTVALLSNVPVVPAGTVPVTLKVTWLPAGKLTRASISPLPLAVPQLRRRRRRAGPAKAGQRRRQRILHPRIGHVVGPALLTMTV